jgi:spermidine synthase
MSPGRRIFLILYAASGAAALVYEVTWTRLLTLQLGHTVAAASTVLAAFMGGLALGAWLAGRISTRGLRSYAALEILVAVCAFLLPFVLAAMVPALAWAYSDGTAPIRFGIVRVAISLIVVGVPAAAMGATFPIAADWYSQSAADTGALYAVNTTGAAMGALAAGFWLIPAFGLRATTWVGVALNAIAAAGAFWLARAGTTTHAERAEHAEKAAINKAPKKSLRVPRTPRESSKRSLRETSSPAPRVAALIAAVSGFSALVYEVAWTRLLALVIGPTTYAFATMAAAFIGGLAIGSAAGSRIARRTRRSLSWLAVLLIAGGIAAVATASYAATRMPLAIAAEVANKSVAFDQVVVWQAFAVGVLLLPMTFALGATFPLALAVASREESTPGADAARVYTANTVGAIAGALAAGFVLIPKLGLRSTFDAAAILVVVTGAMSLVLVGVLADPERQLQSRTHARGEPVEPGARRSSLDPSRASGSSRAESRDDKLRTRGVLTQPVSTNKAFTLRRAVIPMAVAALGIGAIVAMPPWDRELLASGAYKYAPYLASGDFDSVLRAGRLEYYKEGAAGTVSVRRLTGTLSLAIDGKVDASNGGDMLTQRLLGLLPVLLHGRAQDVCVIGLGSGVTVGSALAVPTVRRADVVEISSEVVEASRLFDRDSGRALENSAVRLIVGDGRSHLLLTPRRYDVIVSEPSNPWMAGVAALFTREFFQAARARLKPDGLLCQWAHTYDISAEDLQSIVRTFASVFPQGTLWLVGEGDLLLIGTNGSAINPCLERLGRGWRDGQASGVLADIGIDAAHASFDLASLFAGGPAELQRYGDSAVVQTDDHTRLEYSAPRGIYGHSTGDNAAQIRALATAPPDELRPTLERATDAAWTSRGTMLLRAEAFALAYEAFRRAVLLNSRNVAALSGLSDAGSGAHKPDEVRALLKEIAAKDPGNAPVRIELSHVLAASGDIEGAAASASEALRIAPDDPRAGEQLASVLADAGDADRLAGLADALASRFPDRPDAPYYRATALFMKGKASDAVTAVQPIVNRHPDHARAQNLLGAACATLGQRDCARAAFEASLRANPRDPSTYVNFGVFCLDTGNPRAAAEYFAEALAIDPKSSSAREGLARAHAALNRNPS